MTLLLLPVLLLSVPCENLRARCPIERRPSAGHRAGRRHGASKGCRAPAAAQLLSRRPPWWPELVWSTPVFHLFYLSPEASQQLEAAESSCTELCCGSEPPLCRRRAPRVRSRRVGMRSGLSQLVITCALAMLLLACPHGAEGRCTSLDSMLAQLLPATEGACVAWAPV